MSRLAAIGLGFGDEGKGLVVDWLCSRDPENTKVVRFSGGQQCGHTVIRDGVKHIFASFGSGTLLGCPTNIQKECTVDPIRLLNEYNVLVNKGLNNPTPWIAINRDCPVTFPHDVNACRNGQEMKHGTTGSGIFRTLERHKTLPITFGMLMKTKKTHKLVNKVEKYYGDKHNPEHLDGRLILGWSDFNNSVTELRDLVGVSSQKEVHKKNIVFEGSQGLLLDRDIGFMPHCTPYKLDMTNIGTGVDETYFVTRCYQTRHGNGVMTNSNIQGYDGYLKKNPHETNVTNSYQGDFRISILDVDLLKYGLSKAWFDWTKKRILVVTCLDLMDYYVFTYNGKVTSCSCRKEYLHYLKNALGMDLVYGCDKPDASGIKLY